MFHSLTFFLFLSQFVNFASTFYVDGSVKHCSAEQVSYMKGKCGKYVNYPTSLTEKGGKEEQYAKNVTDTCRSITKDMRIRRGAYTSGKSCLMDFAKNTCAASAIEYLNSNYEWFLEIMTTPTDEEKCDSLHNELIATQCEPELKDIFFDVVATKMAALEGHTIENDLAKKCGSVKQCMSENCYYNATMLTKVDEICEFAVNSTVRGTKFDS
ncbi:unnamed protein product [Caenorhabditis brenneri]